MFDRLDMVKWRSCHQKAEHFGTNMSRFQMWMLLFLGRCARIQMDDVVLECDRRNLGAWLPCMLRQSWGGDVLKLGFFSKRQEPSEESFQSTDCSRISELIPFCRPHPTATSNKAQLGLLFFLCGWGDIWQPFMYNVLSCDMWV